MAPIYFVIFLAASSLTTAFADGTCPDGFLAHQDSCYKEFGIKATWAEASIICKAYGGYLASIDSEDEQLYVASYLSRLGKDAFSPGVFWIGGTDIRTEGIWAWSRTNDPITYKNWQMGQPDNYQGKENCMDFEFDTNFKWNDRDCTQRQNFFCEIPAVQTQVIG